jgi:pimeloyl-ACP methyl ester carboxylesterase
MLSLPVSFFSGRDGVRLAYQKVGEGRLLVLLHGFTGEATLWLLHGQAEAIAAHGHRVIMPDFVGTAGARSPMMLSPIPSTY